MKNLGFKKIIAGVLLSLLVTFSTFGESIKEMEFANQEITDILLILAQVSGNSIVPDETVFGKASYYFREMEFETALKLFLTTYNMYYWKEDNVYYVSKIQVNYERQDDLVSLDAEDVLLEYLIRTLSRSIGKTILYDSLPRDTISVHIEKSTPFRALEIIMKRYANYRVDDEGDHYYIRRLPDPTPTPRPNGQNDPDGRIEQPNLVKKVGDLYSINTPKTRFRQVIDELFRQSGKEYSMLLRNDSILENIYFSNKTFEEILTIILEMANGDFAIAENDVYYLFELQGRKITSRFKTHVVYPLKYVAVSELPALFPIDLISSSLYKIDKQTNSIILSGSVREIQPVVDFIQKVDRPVLDKQYYRFDLKHIQVRDIIAVLPQSYNAMRITPIPGSNAFVMLLSPAKRVELEEFLSIIDQGNEAFPITLKYIKSEDLVNNLPPSVKTEDIQRTNDPTKIFFVGEEEKRARFMKELEVIDQPVPQIRYDVLILQYTDIDNFNWDNSFEFRRTGTSGAASKSLLNLSGLLSIDFDVLSAFGYQFAMNLSYSLGVQETKVFADTTLNGISGQSLKFQSTDTSRHRDGSVSDPDSQNKGTGIIREVTSGIIVDIEGWVSGDGMITIDVSATVSRQNNDASQNGLPSTTEKVVNTHVRTPSGKPVILGGLIEDSSSNENAKKLPFLSDIPIIGSLFGVEKDVQKFSETVIYIIPHIEYPESKSRDVNLKFKEYYYKFSGEGK